jgi:hypothetical protein
MKDIRSIALLGLIGVLTLIQVGCAKKEDVAKVESCAPGTLTETGAGSTGVAYVFAPDPIAGSGIQTLSPTSTRLDDFRSEANLERLIGRGVLAGAYVDVRNGLSCHEGYGAYSKSNQFLYYHGDSQFQEAMSYHYGDQYRAKINESGYLLPKSPVMIVAHCIEDDNAYFARKSDGTNKVCLGDSTKTRGASYADDGAVIVHELQHATTVTTYSPVIDMNRFWYDEASALNEAISDFMSLAYFEPMTPWPIDVRVFSRWALGTFAPNRSGIRGAHRCPAYDTSFPNCENYKSDATGFSASNNSISFVYPDGLGWPFSNNFDAPGYVRSAFDRYLGQEEIHNTGTIITGALWEIYKALQTNHGGNSDLAFSLSSKLVMETLLNLPKPTIYEKSPVTFRGFASLLKESSILLEFSTEDKNSIVNVLTARGLLGDPEVAAGWASVGPGISQTPGLKVLDNPIKLRSWLSQMGADTKIVSQGIGTNDKLSPGDVVAIWFDIQNISEMTAGGLQLTITSQDPDVAFLDESYNVGAILSSEVQIRYGKVNGTAIVSSLTSSNQTYHVPTGNTYFRTNPHFDYTWTTAVWAKVNSNTEPGKTVTLRVEVVPSNGATEILEFLATIE